MSVASETVEFKMTATPQFVANLDRMAAEVGRSPSEVLGMAVALMDMALQAKKEGKQIGIADKDQDLSTVITGF